MLTKGCFPPDESVDGFERVSLVGDHISEFEYVKDSSSGTSDLRKK